MNHIILEGFMGSGKGTIGKKLATEMNLPLIDIDRKIAERMKMTSAEIYDRFGDVYYRALETYMLSEIMKEKQRSVIILGSGLPTMKQNDRYLKELGKVVYLMMDEELLFSKLEKSKKNNWLSQSDDVRVRAKKMLDERQPRYLEIADAVIEVGKKKTADIVSEIIHEIRYPKRKKTVEMSGTPKSTAKKTSLAAPEKIKKNPKVKEEAKKMAKETKKAAPAKKAATAKKAAPAKKATTAKKAVAKKPVAKKAATTKKATTAKKTVAKKPVAKKAATTKKATTAKKTVAKKPVAKKAPAKKATTKKK